MAEYSVYFGKHREIVADDIAVLQLPMKYVNVVNSSMGVTQSKVDCMAKVFSRLTEAGMTPYVFVSKTHGRTYAVLDASISTELDVDTVVLSHTSPMDDNKLMSISSVANQWAKPMEFGEGMVMMETSITDDELNCKKICRYRSSDLPCLSCGHISEFLCKRFPVCHDI